MRKFRNHHDTFLTINYRTYPTSLTSPTNPKNNKK